MTHVPVGEGHGRVVPPSAPWQQVPPGSWRPGQLGAWQPGQAGAWSQPAPIPTEPPLSPAYGPQWQEPVTDAVVNRSVVRAYLKDRLRRFDPRGVPVLVLGLGALVLGGWVLLADLLLTPGIVVPLEAPVPSQFDPRHLLSWMGFVTAYGLGGWAATVLLACQRGLLRALAAAVPAVSTVGTIGLLMLAEGIWERTWGWWIALLVAGAAGIALAIAAACLQRGRIALSVGAGACVATQWATVIAVSLSDPSDTVFVGSWTIFAFLMLIVLGLATIGGVAEWAQRAHVSSDRLAQRLRIDRWVPVALAAVMLVVVVVRLTVLSSLFGPADAIIWTPGEPITWLHAVVAGALVLGVVVWSDRSPLRPRGQLLATTLIAAAAGIGQLLFLVTYVLMLVAPGAERIMDAIGDQFMWIALAITLLLLVLLLPPFRHSTGRAAAIVGLAVIVPFQIIVLFPIPRVVATPTQLLPVVIGGALVLAIVGLARGRDVVDRLMLVRLAVVPCIAVHAGQLIPAVLSDALARPILVAASLVGLVLFGFARRPGPAGASTAFLAPFAVQLGVLGITIVGIVIGGDIDALTTMAVIYLAWPVATVLCCRIAEPAPRFAGTPQPQGTLGG